MIVGTKYVDMSELHRNCTDVMALREYCRLLVPRLFRHDTRIVDNQKYYVAMLVRNIRSIPFDRRKDLYEGLLHGVRVTGIINTIYDVEEAIGEVDMEKLARYRNREIENGNF